MLPLGFKKVFAILLILYYLYRVILDYFKLKSNGIVSKKDIWKFIIPIWTFLYFRDLYCK